MTPEIAKDMIDYLTSRYATDAQVRRWVDNINIWVVPIVNPDGAHYVFTADNMWRKNRHPSSAVDVNRNYPTACGSCNGSSGDCASDLFRGTEPASEPETRSMLDLADAANAFFALSYHSYGEYIMYSYGCNNPDEMTALDEVARALNAILQDDSGQTNSYTVGPIWSAIYIVDGGSIDTQYGMYGAYGFTIEVNASSFQPDYATWRDITVQRQRIAWQLFLDKTLDGVQIRGGVTDAADGPPPPAQIAVQEVTFTHGESPRRADDRGLYHWLARSGQSNVWPALPTPPELEGLLRRRVLDLGVDQKRVAVDDRGVRSNPVFQKSTALINVRPMRTHHWAGVGSLIKNYITFAFFLPLYHPDSCASLGAIWKKPPVAGKTRLNILVMLTPLFYGVGPHHYDTQFVWRYSGLLVGTDPVAVDATGLRILTAKRKAHFGEEPRFRPPAHHIALADTKAVSRQLSKKAVNWLSGSWCWR